MRDMKKLKMLQSYDLDTKIKLSKRRIQEWYEHWEGQVFISFSGGKDSTVLLHLVRSMYPEVPAVFVDTGLEFPEIREFVKTIDNVVWLKPKMSFKKVLEKYGYPVISKEQARYIRDCQNPTPNNEKVRYSRLHGSLYNGKYSNMGTISKKWRYLIKAPFKISEKCCDVTKKQPIYKYTKTSGRKPILGMMAGESRLRHKQWVNNGCNAFDINHPTSNPMFFWVENNVWEYIKRYNLNYASVYDMGYDRTGCIYCMFGVHMEGEPNRFQRLKHTHPKLYEYCMDKLNLKMILTYLGVPF